MNNNEKMVLAMKKLVDEQVEKKHVAIEIYEGETVSCEELQSHLNYPVEMIKQTAELVAKALGTKEVVK